MLIGDQQYSPAESRAHKGLGRTLPDQPSRAREGVGLRGAWSVDRRLLAVATRHVPCGDIVPLDVVEREVVGVVRLAVVKHPVPRHGQVMLDLLAAGLVETALAEHLVGRRVVVPIGDLFAHAWRERVGHGPRGPAPDGSDTASYHDRARRASASRFASRYSSQSAAHL